MIFIGRKVETDRIIKKLCQGKNIIIGGKFGIGRTSLVKKISEIMADKRKFIFVDFSQTPGKMSEKLMRELGLSRRFKKTGRKMGYKSMRYRIATVRSSIKNKPVIVFDNIAKLTSQKIIFLRNLIEENRFQFIAIVEHFLPANDLMLLKVQFFPTETVTLHHFNVSEIKNLLQTYSNQYRLNWSDDYIRHMVTLANGYPLGLTEMLKKKRKGYYHV